MKLFISQFEDISENNQSGEANNESDEDESLHLEEDVFGETFWLAHKNHHHHIQ